MAIRNVVSLLGALIFSCDCSSIYNSPQCSGRDTSEECPRDGGKRRTPESETVLMQLRTHRAIAPRCCDKCGGKAYCSPVSGNCYDEKAKKYYETCEVDQAGATEPESSEPPAEGACCGNCGGAFPFCSPNSGNCYGSKAKDYYETCKVDQAGATEPESPEPEVPTLPGCYFRQPPSASSNEECLAGSMDEWTRDDWGEKYANAGKSEEACMARKDGHDRHCRLSSEWIFVPCQGSDCPINWGPTSVTSGTGLWCEVRRPAMDWSPLKTCPTDMGGSTTVKILTYNLFWWNLFDKRGGNSESAGRLIANTAGPEQYDLMGFQECDDVWRVMGDAWSHGLSGEYGAINGGRALAIAYRKSRYTLLSSGAEDVGEDASEQYYGKRTAQWARLQHRDGSTIFFVNHHGPLPVSKNGGCTGSATSYNIIRLIAENANSGDVVILVGDFNAALGSSRIWTLDNFMHRVYSGTSHGGVDHIFSNCNEKVTTHNLGAGGSDHDALSVVFTL